MTYFSIYTRVNGKTNCFISNKTGFTGEFHTCGHATIKQAIQHIADNKQWANKVDMNKVWI